MRVLATSMGALLAAALAAAVTPARAAESRPERWFQEVRLLVLPEEEALHAELKDPADRAEFERIFWARRDPDPTTPANELQTAVARARARADERFTRPGQKGADTDCGQLFILLGEPLEVAGRETKARFDSAEALRGARRPEVWTYRRGPGDAVPFTGGELRVALDEDCRFADEGARVRDDLHRVARSKVVQPRLSYMKKPDGHLARLEDVRAALASAPLPVAAIPTRADFPLTIEPKLLMRTASGEAYAAGLIRAQLGPAPGDGAAPAALAATVIVQAEEASGQIAPRFERPVRGTVAADGAFIASYGVPLKPGRYVLHVGLLAGDKSSLVSTPVEVPDFDAPGLKLGSLLVYPEGEPAATDAQDPYSAFAVGALRLHPRFGNVFSPAESLQAVCVLYGGEVDPETKKPSLRARLTFSKDGRPVAAGPRETFDTASAVVSVGPVPLARFTPGRYRATVEAIDLVSGKSQTQETEFEIAP